MVEVSPHTRHILLEGADNVRDVGGMVTTEGHLVRYGAVFRGDSLSGLTDADVEALAEMRISAAVDFRGHEEIERAGADRLPDGCAWTRVPLADPATQLLASTLTAAFTSGEAAQVEELLGEGRAEQIGAGGFFNSLNGPEAFAGFATTLQCIAETVPTGGAVIYHCTSGKDRTGFMTVLLLGILGVDDDQIIDDYLASNHFNDSRHRALRERLRQRGIRPELVDPLLAQHPGQIQPFLDRVRAEGGWLRFAQEQVGLPPDTIATLRECLLSPVPDDRLNTDLDNAWDTLITHLGSTAAVVRGEARAADPRLRAQGYKYLLNLLNAALEQAVFSADVDFPEHGRLQDSTKRYATESPDCLFGVSALDPAGTYRIIAGPGSAHYVGFTLYREMDFYGAVKNAPPTDYRTVFAAATGSTLGAMAAPGDLVREQDGSFEVILSTARPADWRGNWLPMPPETHHVITRQYFNDWATEVPHHIGVERLDPSGPGPVDRPDQVAAKLLSTGELSEGHALFWQLLYRAKSQREVNVLTTQPTLSEGYAGGGGGHVAYGGGHLLVAPDEAAIIEFTPPDCHFWNFQLGDIWGQSLDYTWRQTHLNGHMARLDPDGVFRGVVAHVDPGVANWFDTAGNDDLHVTYRWWLMPEPSVVHPEVRIVKLADLDRELHPATPRVTPAERAATLRVRRDAVLRRYGR